MYEGRWRHILETYEELGMLDGPVDLEGFLYDANPEKDYTRLAWVTGGALVTVGWGILLPVWRLNRRLRVEIAEAMGGRSVVREGGRFVAELPLCEAPLGETPDDRLGRIGSGPPLTRNGPGLV